MVIVRKLRQTTTKEEIYNSHKNIYNRDIKKKLFY